MKILVYHIIFLTGIFLYFPALGQEQDTQSQLVEIEKQIEQSEEEKQKLAQEAQEEQAKINTLTQNMVSTAKEIQNQEALLTQTELEAEQIEEAKNLKEQSLETRSEELLKTLAALQKLSQKPPELVLIKPTEAINTIRSASLLATTLPAIQKEAQAIRSELTELERLRAALISKKAQVSLGLNELEEKSTELNAYIAERKETRKNILTEVDQESRRIANLAREAKDLRTLLETLNSERQRREEAAREAENRAGKPQIVPSAPPSQKPISKARGDLALPVIGNVIERFGAQSQVGNSRGVRIETRKGAQVIAPFDGRVVFAGPFRTYGQLLIIDHGEGYHTLLAGMSTLNGDVGQWVLEGEPVGTMDSGNINGVSLGATSRKPELYVELRRNGNPVNPLPWMASRAGKASGK